MQLNVWEKRKLFIYSIMKRTGSDKTHFLSFFSNSLNIVVLLSKVAEHVTIVTVHVPTEDFDVVLRTELVHTHHQVSGAACQTHLRKKERKKNNSQSWFNPKATFPKDTSDSKQHFFHLGIFKISLWKKKIVEAFNFKFV